MRSLIGRISFVFASLIALLGISAGNLMASPSDVSGKTPLYLEHGKQTTRGIVYDHESHHSHHSHHSHYSSH